jgi:hypothetical protein
MLGVDRKPYSVKRGFFGVFRRDYPVSPTDCHPFREGEF